MAHRVSKLARDIVVNVNNDSAEATTKSVGAAVGPGCSRSVSAIVFGAVSAVVTAFVFYAVYMFATSGPRLPEVDQARLDEARAQWKQNGPADYNIEVAVSGPRAAIYRVEVRDGKAVKATRDGSPLTDVRTLGTWSVPGMFDTVQSDVDHIDKPIQITARESHYVSPRAEFHPQLGYPLRYRRIEWGSDIEAAWEVTEFEPLR